ncbi:unnamed protein product [Moneuplotes crassus]|uniref:EF-hand domain-containing protein n=1 Tax=Euplotes crassus TaxID=5936 RepID=A0AAD1Y4A9_EUPCR|nr:unnamed protein product [Moneuplotes crassus]
MLINSKCLSGGTCEGLSLRIVKDFKNRRVNPNRTYLNAESNPDHLFDQVGISRKIHKRGLSKPKGPFTAARKHLIQSKRLFSKTQLRAKINDTIRNPIIKTSGFSNESSSIASGRTRNIKNFNSGPQNSANRIRNASNFNSIDPPQRVSPFSKYSPPVGINKTANEFPVSPAPLQNSFTTQNSRRINFQNSKLRSNLLHTNFKASIMERREQLDPNREALQKHFMEMCDVKGSKLYNYSLSRQTFRDYMLKRYCTNVTERVIFLMQLPKRVKYEKYVECCNNLIKMSHYEKLKLSFGFFDHDFDDKISVTDGLLMMRHLTDTEYLMQEDLRVLVKGLLDKQKFHKKLTRRDIHVIPEFNDPKKRIIDKKISVASEEKNNRKMHEHLGFFKEENMREKFRRLMKNSSNSSINPAASPRRKAEGYSGILSRNSSFHEDDNHEWNSDDSFFSDTETNTQTVGPLLEELSSTKTNDAAYMRNKPHKKNKHNLRVEDICDTFSKKTNKRANFYRSMERYCQKKYLFHDHDYLEFKDYMKLKFSCPAPLDSSSFVSTVSKFHFMEDRKKNMQKVKTVYPSILYDVYYYVCLYEFEDIKIINPDYYTLIRKQIAKLPMIDDQELIKKRSEVDYLYNDARLKELINDLTNTHGMVKKINIDHLLNK